MVTIKIAHCDYSMAAVHNYF